MFGGSGIYAEGLCFAIELRGEVFLKTDEVTRPNFAAVDSTPSIYGAKGKPRPTSYWRLPEVAHDGVPLAMTIAFDPRTICVSPDEATTVLCRLERPRCS
jgi:TfoX/Sxy family transcriptional regulator of competence genes